MAKQRADDANDERTAQEVPADQSVVEQMSHGETPESDLDPVIELELLREQLAAAELASVQSQEEGLRVRAEMDNLRKRTARDLEHAHKFALDRFAQDLLPVCDSLELGLSAARQMESTDAEQFIEGSELTLKMLTGVMEKFGIHAVAAEGEKFNPDHHQAMATQQVDGVEPGTVLTVYQKGYTLNDRLMRPAMVIVSA